MFFDIPIEIRKEIFKSLSDEMLIKRLSIVSKKDKTAVLEILFERGSPTAWTFQEKYIRRYMAGKQKSNSKDKPEVLAKFCNKKATYNWPTSLILLQQSLNLAGQWTLKDRLIFKLASLDEMNEGMLFYFDVKHKEMWEKICNGLKDSDDSVCRSAYEAMISYLKHDQSVSNRVYEKICEGLEDERMSQKAYQAMRYYLDYVQSIPEGAYEKICNGFKKTFESKEIYRTMRIYLKYSQSIDVYKKLYDKLLSEQKSPVVQSTIYETMAYYFRYSQSAPSISSIEWEKICDGLEDFRTYTASSNVILAYLTHPKILLEDAYARIRILLKNNSGVGYKALEICLTRSQSIPSDIWKIICDGLEKNESISGQLAIYNAMTAYLTHSKVVSEDAYEKIYSGLKNSEQTVREAACKAIIAYLNHSQFKSINVYTEICKLLKENSEFARESAYNIMTDYLTHCQSMPDDVYEKIYDGLNDNNKLVCTAACQAMTAYLENSQFIPDDIYKKIGELFENNHELVREAAYNMMSVYLKNTKSMPGDVYKKICAGLELQNEKIFVRKAAYQAMIICLNRIQSIPKDACEKIVDGLCTIREISSETMKALTEFVLKQPVKEQIKLLSQIINRLDLKENRTDIYKFVLLVLTQIEVTNPSFKNLNDDFNKIIENWISSQGSKSQLNIKYFLIQKIEQNQFTREEKEQLDKIDRLEEEIELLNKAIISIQETKEYFQEIVMKHLPEAKTFKNFCAHIKKINSSGLGLDGKWDKVNENMLSDYKVENGKIIEVINDQNKKIIDGWKKESWKEAIKVYDHDKRMDAFTAIALQQKYEPFIKVAGDQLKNNFLGIMSDHEAFYQSLENFLTLIYNYKNEIDESVFKSEHKEKIFTELFKSYKSLFINSDFYAIEDEHSDRKEQSKNEYSELKEQLDFYKEKISVMNGAKVQDLEAKLKAKIEELKLVKDQLKEAKEGGRLENVEEERLSAVPLRNNL